VTRAPARARLLAAWVLTGSGIALAVMAGTSSLSPLAGRPAFVGGIALMAAGFVAAAAYQVAARAGRPADAYRGPSPVALFVAAAGLTSLAVVLAGSVPGLIDLETPVGVLVSLVASATAYASLVVALVVRPGALSWTDMGWPARGPADGSRYLRDVIVAVGIVAPTYLASAFLGGLLALALGVNLASPLPVPSSTGEILLTILGALVVAPVGEELFFRGYALTAWWRDLGPSAALVRSMAFFAVIHLLNVSSASVDEFLRMAILQVVVILPVGYVLGRLFVRRGMAAAIAGHVSFNAIALLLFLTATRA
jgi:membrane protease YdiL (CAAX protease family)